MGKEKDNCEREGVNGELVFLLQVFPEDQFQQRTHMKVEKLNTNFL